jgi:hypothetical protein
MSDAATKHPLSTRILAWSFALTVLTVIVGAAVGLVWLIVAVWREGS